jgi:hypothetical protein
VQGGARCPEGHPLVLVPGSENGWLCDLCGEHKPGEEAAWRCGEDRRWGRGGGCDYDVCQGCLDTHTAAASRLPHPGDPIPCSRLHPYFHPSPYQAPHPPRHTFIGYSQETRRRTRC